jgi:hypothetical protein
MLAAIPRFLMAVYPFRRQIAIGQIDVFLQRVNPDRVAPEAVRHYICGS